MLDDVLGRGTGQGYFPPDHVRQTVEHFKIQWVGYRHGQIDPVILHRNDVVALGDLVGDRLGEFQIVAEIGESHKRDAGIGGERVGYVLL